MFNEGVLVKDSQTVVKTNENSKSNDKLEFKVEPSEWGNTSETIDSDSVAENEENKESPQDQ